MESDTEYEKRIKEYKKQIHEKMLCELERDGLIVRNEYGSEKLTERGLIEAEKVIYLTGMSSTAKFKRI